MSSISIRTAQEEFRTHHEPELLRRLARGYSCNRIYKYASYQTDAGTFTDYKLITRPADEKALLASRGVYNVTLVYDAGRVIATGSAKRNPHHSLYAGDLPCPHCRQPNAAVRWPARGDLVPYYCQTEPGRYQVTVLCAACQRSWHVVWDDDPGPGCDDRPPARPAAAAATALATAPVRWNCIECDHLLRATTVSAGKRAKCPQCGRPQAVPAADCRWPATLRPYLQPEPDFRLEGLPFESLQDATGYMAYAVGCLPVMPEVEFMGTVRLFYVEQHPTAAAAAEALIQLVNDRIRPSSPCRVFGGRSPYWGEIQAGGRSVRVIRYELQGHSPDAGGISFGNYGVFRLSNGVYLTNVPHA